MPCTAIAVRLRRSIRPSFVSSLEFRAAIRRIGGQRKAQPRGVGRHHHARPNAAISAQELDPHRTETKAMTSNSPKSCRALLARGSGTSSKADRKICIGGRLSMRSPYTTESTFRRKRGEPRTRLQKRSPRPISKAFFLIDNRIRKTSMCLVCLSLVIYGNQKLGELQCKMSIWNS